MVQSRVWEHQVKCGINETVDLTIGHSGQIPTGVDLSVVNVFQLFEASMSDECAYSLAFLSSMGNISNGLFVFNVTVDAN